MAKTPARKTPSRGAASKAAVGRIEEIARNLPASHWTVNGLVARTNDGAVFVIPLNQLEQFRVRDLESGAARTELTRFFQDSRQLTTDVEAALSILLHVLNDGCG